MKRFFITELLALLLISIFSICAVNAQDLAIKQDFVVSIIDAEIVFDVHHAYSTTEAQLFTGIYEGLFTYHPQTLAPVPAACESFEKSADELTYTFKIRANARWSNGDQVRAQDFRDSWLRILSPETEAEYSSLFDVISGAKAYRLGQTKTSLGVGIEAVSDKVLKVRLAYPVPYFTHLLSHHSFSPMHPLMFKKGAFKEPNKIICNGPFYIAQDSSTELSLKTNQYYWDAKALKIDGITIKKENDDDKAAYDFNSGVTHWIEGGVNYKLLLDQNAIQLSALFGTHYWFFSCKEKPWNDARMRKALAYLIPWDEIRVRDQYLQPTANLIYPLAGYPKIKGINAKDSAKAMLLFKEAGFEDLKTVPLITIMIPEGEDSKRIASIMEKAFTEVGLKVSIKTVAPTRFFTSTKTESFTISSVTWIGDYADPHTFLQMWLKDSNLNDAKFFDPDFEELMAQSNRQKETARFETLAKAEELLLTKAEVMPIYHNIGLNIIDTGYILGWYPNVLDIHPFKYIEFGKQEAAPNVVLAY